MPGERLMNQIGSRALLPLATISPLTYQLNLGAHFFNLRGLLFQLPSQLCDNGFQCLHFEIEHGFLAASEFLGLLSLVKIHPGWSIGNGGAQSSIRIEQHESRLPGGIRRTGDICR